MIPILSISVIIINAYSVVCRRNFVTAVYDMTFLWQTIIDTYFHNLQLSISNEYCKIKNVSKLIEGGSSNDKR